MYSMTLPSYAYICSWNKKNSFLFMIVLPSQSSLIQLRQVRINKDHLQEGKAFSSQVVLSFLISYQTSLAETGSASGDQ